MEHEDYVDYKDLAERQAKQIEDLHIRVAAMQGRNVVDETIDYIAHMLANTDPMRLMVGTYVVCTVATTIVTIAMDIKRGMRW